MNSFTCSSDFTRDRQKTQQSVCCPEIDRSARVTNTRNYKETPIGQDGVVGKNVDGKGEQMQSQRKALENARRK